MASIGESLVPHAAPPVHRGGETSTPGAAIAGAGVPRGAPPNPFETLAVDPRVQELRGKWTQWIAQPGNREGLLQFGLQMSQPIQPGQSFIGHTAQAVGGGFEAKDRNLALAEEQRRADAASQRDDLSLQLQQQQVDVGRINAEAQMLNAMRGQGGTWGDFYNDIIFGFEDDRLRLGDYSEGSLGALYLDAINGVPGSAAQFAQRVYEFYQAGASIESMGVPPPGAAAPVGGASAAGAAGAPPAAEAPAAEGGESAYLDSILPSGTPVGGDGVPVSEGMIINYQGTRYTFVGGHWRPV